MAQPEIEVGVAPDEGEGRSVGSDDPAAPTSPADADTTEEGGND